MTLEFFRILVCFSINRLVFLDHTAARGLPLLVPSPPQHEWHLSSVATGWLSRERLEDFHLRLTRQVYHWRIVGSRLKATATWRITETIACSCAATPLTLRPSIMSRRFVRLRRGTTYFRVLTFPLSLISKCCDSCGISLACGFY